MSRQLITLKYRHSFVHFWWCKKKRANTNSIYDTQRYVLPTHLAKRFPHMITFANKKQGLFLFLTSLELLSSMEG